MRFGSLPQSAKLLFHSILAPKPGEFSVIRLGELETKSESTGKDIPSRNTCLRRLAFDNDEIGEGLKDFEL